MIGFIRNNPEFKRNRLIELTPFRLVIMPIIIGILVYGVYLTEPGKISVIYFTAQIIYYILVFVWGSKLAADSVIGEFNDGTWDSQKMTLLTPAEMTIGKVFGGTLYAWYGGIVCALILFCTAFQMPHSYYWFTNIISLVLNGITFHSISIIFGLSSIIQNRNKKKLNSALPFLIPISLGILLLIFRTILQITTIAKFSDPFRVHSAILYVKWWFIDIDPAIFSIFTSMVYAFWGLMGVYAFFRQEMRYRNSPALFIWFIITISLYYSGLNVSKAQENFSNSVLIILATIFFVSLIITYLGIFYERKDPLNISRQFENISISNLMSNWSNVPRWMLSATLTTVVGITIIVHVILTRNVDIGFWQYKFTHQMTLDPFASILTIAGIILFMIRDLSLILSLHFTKNPKNPAMAAILFLLLLYSIVPLIAYSLAKDTAAAFIPFFFIKNGNTLSNSVLIIFIAIQTFVFLQLALQKYSERISFLISEN